MTKVRIDKELKNFLDSIKIEYLKRGKTPPSYNILLKNQLRNKNKGILYDETIFF